MKRKYFNQIHVYAKGMHTQYWPTLQYVPTSDSYMLGICLAYLRAYIYMYMCLH
jgi:hypothetical protein